MGAVYEAIHEEIARSVAIKVLRAQDAGDSEYTARLLNEARAVNIIRHRSIVGISDIGRLPDGSPYIVMEYLDGETLRTAMQRKPPLPALLRLARQIASALAAAHEKNIIHRDLKPDNVMVVEDPEVVGGVRAIILDFGVAKLAAEDKHPETVEQQTDVRMPMGTAKYMSPEQAALEPIISDRTDVYALGVMLYELLSGAPPFSASTYALLLDMHRFSAPIPLNRLVPSLDPRLVKLVNYMLAKKPAERPSMADVAATLEGILSSEANTNRGTEREVPEESTLQSPRAARWTEPIQQMADTALAEAASALLSDSETMVVIKTAQVEAPPAAHSYDNQTLPLVRSRPRLSPSARLGWRNLRRWQQAAALLLALAVLAWIVALAAR